MKLIKQFGIILTISFAGEFLNYVIPLPIPASIYGLVLMLLCLQGKLFPVSAVKETAGFLVEIMPMMFIPAAVGLMNSWDIVRANLVAYLVITVVSTLVVLLVSGAVTQWILRRSKKGGEPQ